MEAGDQVSKQKCLNYSVHIYYASNQLIFDHKPIFLFLFLFTLTIVILLPSEGNNQLKPVSSKLYVLLYTDFIPIFIYLY